MNQNTLHRVAITETRNGNLLIAFSAVDGGTETTGRYRSTDAGATWSARTASVFESTGDAVTSDFALGYPADTGDDADAASLYWDVSALATSIKIYDDSADKITETAIGTAVASVSISHWDTAVRHSDGHIILAVHSNDDDATDDLRVYNLTPDSIATPTVAALTNVFTDQAESGLCAVLINQQNDDIYVAYGKGGSSFNTVDVVSHVSLDDGSTWEAEEAYSEAVAADNRRVSAGRTIGAAGGFWQPSWFEDDLNDIFINLVNDVGAGTGASGTPVVRGLETGEFRLTNAGMNGALE